LNAHERIGSGQDSLSIQQHHSPPSELHKQPTEARPGQNMGGVQRSESGDDSSPTLSTPNDEDPSADDEGPKRAVGSPGQKGKVNEASGRAVGCEDYANGLNSAPTTKPTKVKLPVLYSGAGSGHKMNGETANSPDGSAANRRWLITLDPISTTYTSNPNLHYSPNLKLNSDALHIEMTLGSKGRIFRLGVSIRHYMQL